MLGQESRMSQATLEQRLSVLEGQVAEILKQNGGSEPKAGWLDGVRGSQKQEADFAQVLALGREQRRADRPTEGS